MGKSRKKNSRKQTKSQRNQKPRTVHQLGRPSRKRLGEAIEAAFLARGTMFNFDISKPWGETHFYDFVVSPGVIRFWRVQVKGTQRYCEHRYRVKGSGSSNQPYTPDQIDFIAAYIVPENIWYIIPIEAFLGAKNLRFYPRTRHGQYEKYREAWCLLACDPKSRGPNNVPSSCRCRELPVRCAVCPCGTDRKCGTDTPVRRR